MLIGEVNFCQDTASVWGMLGYLVMIIKIVIPLLLIILGMLDLGKAVVASDDKAINKAVNTLVKRFVAAIILFFVPTIVSAVFSMFYGDDFTSGNANLCVQCLTHPGNVQDKDGNNLCKSALDVSEIGD